MPSIKNIAIIGAGGQIGSVITRALLAQNLHTLTAITRAESKNTMPSGLTIKTADYASHASLVEAMRGQDALIITMNVLAPRDTQFKLIDAAFEAGVKWVMPNEYGLDLQGKFEAMGRDVTLGEGQAAVRAYIEKTGQGKMHWMSISCSFWYEFSLAGTEARYGFDFQKKALTLIDDGETKILTTTWPQVGRAVAAVMALPYLEADATPGGGLCLSKLRNHPVHISSFRLSQRDMLASVLRVTGDKEADWTFTSEPSGERFQRGVKMFKEGNFMGFGIFLYTRSFYPHDPADYSEMLESKALGLPEEDLDAATEVAIGMAGRGEWGIHV